jgi:hypothetical protein
MATFWMGEGSPTRAWLEVVEDFAGLSGILTGVSFRIILVRIIADGLVLGVDCSVIGVIDGGEV